jgi:Bacterial transcriptional activator domain
LAHGAPEGERLGELRCSAGPILGTATGGVVAVECDRNYARTVSLDGVLVGPDGHRRGTRLADLRSSNGFGKRLVLEPHRESYRQLRLHSLEAICDQLIQRERFGEALEAAFMAISTSPFRESAHRAVVFALLAEGNRGEALRHYERFRGALKEELGVEPSFWFDDLRQQSPSATP